ncbi:MAG: NAD-dependent epimerase/dehydratase family protein [bacterium]
MKVLITGVAGFIGSHLASALIEKRQDVVGIDKFSDYYPREYKERNIKELLDNERFKLIEGDLLSMNLSSILQDIEIVFHQAAQPGVRRSWDMFDVYVRDNILATQRLLESIKKKNIKKFVYASSSSVYGDCKHLPLKEEYIPKPLSPYGVTKLSAENLVELYRKNYGIPAISLRYFTVFGPHQRPDMAFFKFIKAGFLNEPIVVYGDGSQTRDFTYVSDIIDANIHAAESNEEGIFNIGGGNRVTLNDVIKDIERFIGKDIKIEYRDKQKGDMKDTLADITKAKKHLSFSPKVSLSSGLHKEIKWLHSILSKKK